MNLQRETWNVRRSDRGFTLIEVLAAASIFAFAFLGLLAMVVVAMQSNTLSHQTAMSTTLAEDLAEKIKQAQYTDPWLSPTTGCSGNAHPCGTDIRTNCADPSTGFVCANPLDANGSTITSTTARDQYVRTWSVSETLMPGRDGVTGTADDIGVKTIIISVTWTGQDNVSHTVWHTLIKNSL